ncbi:tetratricopeptide repeat protein [Litoricolaceae bacterium]|nr:tetratricopeptide repeat protein [Litorivicinaceae bacterium]
MILSLTRLTPTPFAVSTLVRLLSVFALATLAVELRAFEIEKNDERQAAFLTNELNRYDQAPSSGSSHPNIEQIIGNSSSSRDVIWRLLASDRRIDNSWSRIDRLVVQELLQVPRSRSEFSVPAAISSTLLAKSARHGLMNQILSADRSLQTQSLKSLDSLSEQYQIRLFATLTATDRVRDSVETATLRENFTASQKRADIALSAQIAQRILDREPHDTIVRNELVSLLHQTNEAELANDHRLTLALLDQESASDTFLVVEDVSTKDVVVNDEFPVPATTNEIAREDFETTLDYLAERIFQDPSNLNLNLEYFKEQVARGDLEGAEVTLERILLIDPESKFAKVLMAETQIKLGKLPEARNILNRLLADPELAADMRQKALDYVAQIEDLLNPVTWRHSVGLTAGLSNNALGRTGSGTVLYRDLALASGQSDVDVSFNELSFDTSMSYLLPYETPTTITVTGFGSGRQSDHEDLSRTSTVGGSASIKEIDDGTILESTLSAVQTRVDGEPYANFASLAASLMTGLTESLVVGSNLAYSKNMYQDFEGIANNTNNSSETVVMSLSLMGQVKKVGWSVTGKWADTNAKDASVSNDLQSLAMALNYRFDNCSNLLSADRAWTQAKAANTFVSSQAKRVTQTNWTYVGSCVVENFWNGVSIEPSYKFVWRESDSNIPNYAKESSEYSLGVKLRF